MEFHPTEVTPPLQSLPNSTCLRVGCLSATGLVLEATGAPKKTSLSGWLTMATCESRSSTNQPEAPLPHLEFGRNFHNGWVQYTMVENELKFYTNLTHKQIGHTVSLMSSTTEILIRVKNGAELRYKYSAKTQEQSEQDLPTLSANLYIP